MYPELVLCLFNHALIVLDLTEQLDSGSFLRRPGPRGGRNENPSQVCAAAIVSMPDRYGSHLKTGPHRAGGGLAH
jgi:hypothetical protein